MAFDLEQSNPQSIPLALCKRHDFELDQAAFEKLNQDSWPKVLDLGDDKRAVFFQDDTHAQRGTKGTWISGGEMLDDAATPIETFISYAPGILDKIRAAMSNKKAERYGVVYFMEKVVI